MNNQGFQPVRSFTWDINRAERSRQVRWLAPLLDTPEGRTWFLEQLRCSCSADEARMAEVYHLCFPLRDIFTEDYYRCRGNPVMENQFIVYYNELFSLPVDFGIETIWKTAPGGEIRHPCAGGRAGWYEDFLKKRIPDPELYNRARNVRRMLGTEADALILTRRRVVLIECKYLTTPSLEQHERHLLMGETLARRLGKDFHFGMVVESDRDPEAARFQAPYVLWREVEQKLK